MRFKKAEDLLKVAFAMQGSAYGVSLDGIQELLEGASRRTAERARDALERIFPNLIEVRTGERVKRWRLPAGTLNSLISYTPSELVELDNAIAVFKQKNLRVNAKALEGIKDKIQSSIRYNDRRKLETDLEVLTEAEGIAMRPLPRRPIDSTTFLALRSAILGSQRIEASYFYRKEEAVRKCVLEPYGFLYGVNNYLVARDPTERKIKYFVLGCIKDVEILPVYFSKSKSFSIKKMAAKSFGIWQEKPINIRLLFSPGVSEIVSNFHFHPSQKLRQKKDGSTEVQLFCGGLKELCFHLFTWGGEVKILAPKKLKDMYSEMLNDAIQPKF